MSSETQNGWTSTMRWTARLLGLVAVALFAFFAVTSGPTVFSRLDWISLQGAPLLVALAVALAGVLIAWRSELVGGAMALGGAIVTMVLVCGGSGLDMFLCGLFFTLPLLLSGALFLGCCARTSKAVVQRV